MPAPTRALPVRPMRPAGPLVPAIATLGVLVTEGDSSVFEAGASTDGLCRTRREATYAFTVASP